MSALDLTNRKSPEERNRLDKPSNAGIAALFNGVDRVIIKEDGVSGDKAISDTILLEISSQEEICQLQAFLQIDETNTGFYCMCLGTYAIELFADSQLKATIGFHHGETIRYINWNGDAGLARSEDLLHFLAELGLSKPLEQYKEEKLNRDQQVVAERKWLEYAPASFRKYREEMNDFDDSYLPLLAGDLKAEIPDKNERIIRLLQLFGYSSHFWTGYPLYEEVPNELLKTLDTKEIINAYLQSDRNYKTRKGLGRFLCSFEFKKERAKYMECISEELIAELEKCFNQLNEKRGIDEIAQMKKEKLYR